MKKIAAFLKRMTTFSMALLMTGIICTALPKQTASAANTEWKFDFGGGGTASGYTGVSASDGYNASRGYGFSAGTSAANIAASGSGALSDAVQFKNSTSNGN